MKFATNEDIKAPIESVFKAVSDFETFERFALRRGAEIGRIDPAPGGVEKTRWDLMFLFKGKQREVVAELAAFEAPNGLRIVGGSRGIEGDIVVDLVSLSKLRTRLSVSLELRARTLSGRLLLQSLKLMRGKLKERFKTRVARFAKDIESDKPYDGRF